VPADLACEDYKRVNRASDYKGVLVKRTNLTRFLADIPSITSADGTPLFSLPLFVQEGRNPLAKIIHVGTSLGNVKLRS
jgi:hypothetical protein